MSVNDKVFIIMIFALVLNLPFGYLRSRHPKRSAMWFLYIHIPIPFVVLMRYVTSISMNFMPLSLAASIVGQYVGGKIYQKKRKRRLL
ncbi:hypothetical protein MCHI_001696 [Candidatus Magnetoovum chiemensis]|nr:hypothetical protein MCHI_001696 [Candidatus Magnetoovum chiemensis]